MFGWEEKRRISEGITFFSREFVPDWKNQICACFLVCHSRCRKGDFSICKQSIEKKEYCKKSLLSDFFLCL